MLLFFLDGAMMQGFLPVSARRIFIHANSDYELINLLQAYRPEVGPIISPLRPDENKRENDDDSKKNGDKDKKNGEYSKKQKILRLRS